MNRRGRSRTLLVVIALSGLVVMVMALRQAISFYGRPFPSVLVDPEGVVSGVGLPEWAGPREGLRHPDRIVEVDGQALDGSGYRFPAVTLDRAVARAHGEGRSSVHVRVETRAGKRDLDLPIAPFDPFAWWVFGGSLVLIGGLYVGAALVALSASPRGPLARTFARTILMAGLYLLTMFDWQTTRALTPLFRVAFATVWIGFVVLPLRLPDDTALLERRPWLVRTAERMVVVIALGMLALDAIGPWASPMRMITSMASSALLGGSLVFLGATMVVRFVRATGQRRDVLRALLGAMVPAHVLIGVGVSLAAVRSQQSALFCLAFPALALTPASSAIAFIRHDLWGSRALLSRVLTRFVLATLACVLAVALGTGIAAWVGVPIRGALFAASWAGVAAVALVMVMLELGDMKLFPSRAQYKPTIEQLSEELTSITTPEEVAHAIERTVCRWLPCERAEFSPVVSSSQGEEQSGEFSVAAGIRVDAPVEVPVSFGGRKMGVLRVGRKHGGALFTSEDMDLLRTIANQAALALAHAHSYAELEGRRRDQMAAWRGERSAVVQTLAHVVAHEVQFPLNFFRSVFERGARGDSDPSDMDIGLEEVERLARLLRQLKELSVAGIVQRVISVRELALKTETLLRDALGSRRAALRIEEDVALRCDPDQMTQVLVNLLSNALEAAGPDGEVGVEWSMLEDGGGRLIVWDSGPGFAGEGQNLFKPWVTTKPGTRGLGLAIAQRILEGHGWSITAERTRDRTRFVLSVPRASIVGAASEESEAVA